MSAAILVIEDNEQNRYLARFLLESKGHRVAVAEDGPEGIAMAAELAPDLILLDIQLPTMDGYAVAQALRRCEAAAATPIVAVTSYAMPGDRQKAMEAGCDGYIEKPIDPDRFVAQVEAFLAPRPLEARS